MPFIRRQVGFDPIPDYSRLPHDDEAYVMKAFARHAAHCNTCAHPYEVHKQGGTLCTKGHQRALDVAKYLYSKGDRTFSIVDLESNIRTRVEIPAGCDAVRGLLKAMERGLALRRRVSYDENYYVAPRRIPTETIEDCGRPRSTRKPLHETVVQPGLAERTQQRREKPRHVGRGSLFEEDIRDRERRRQSMRPVYYEATPRHSAYPNVDDWD